MGLLFTQLPAIRYSLAFLDSGGKAQSVHSHRGQSVTLEADDQLPQDKSVQALLSNYYTRRPLVLLIDDKYAQFPYDLGSKGITYAVLGFYTIVHAWGESHRCLLHRRV